MTVFTAISHVSFGDSWSAANHNLLLDNAEAPFSSAVQYSLLYWSTTTAIGAIALSAGQFLQGVASAAPAGAYPPGIELPIMAARAPFSGVAAAARQSVEGSGAGTQKIVIDEALFVTGTDNGLIWDFKLRNAIGTSKLKISYVPSTSEASKNLKWAVYIAAVSAGDTSWSAKVFGTVNNQTDVPGSTSEVATESIVTLTNMDSAAKDDWISLFLMRDTTVATNHAGTMKVRQVEFLYG